MKGQGSTLALVPSSTVTGRITEIREGCGPTVCQSTPFTETGPVACSAICRGPAVWVMLDSSREGFWIDQDRPVCTISLPNLCPEPPRFLALDLKVGDVISVTLHEIGYCKCGGSCGAGARCMEASDSDWQYVKVEGTSTVTMTCVSSATCTRLDNGQPQTYCVCMADPAHPNEPLCMGVIPPACNPHIVTSTTGSMQTISFTGTVHYSSVEGGCWYIQADSTNTNYQPMNLPSGVLVDGSRIQITGIVRTDMLSICNIGWMLQVTSYSIIGSYTTSLTAQTVTITTGSTFATATMTTGCCPPCPTGTVCAPCPPDWSPCQYESCASMSARGGCGTCQDEQGRLVSYECPIGPKFPTAPQSLSDVPRFLTQFWLWVRCQFFHAC